MKYRIRPALVGDSAQLVTLVDELGYPTNEDFIQEKLTQLSAAENTERMLTPFMKQSGTLKTAGDS
jgi:hypothetical protein